MYKIFGKDNCSYCNKAKQLLEQFEYPYEYIDVVEDESALSMLKEMGFRTVPQIYREDRHIGGYTELFNLITTENEGV